MPENPYQGPSANLEPTPAPTPAKVPISAYVMALISGAFVTFGAYFAIAFSGLFFGSWLQSAPGIVIQAIPYGAMALGILSAWQTIRRAKRKAMLKQMTS